MKTHALPLAIILCICPTIARAQVRVGIDIGLPAAPQLVVVAPGIQVVEGFQDEVFFQGGWYWCRRSDGWYRARSPQAHFDWIDGHRVPGGLTRTPAGRYRNWHHDGPGPGRGQAMGVRDAGHHRAMARSARGEGKRKP
ncbi:MAG: hypothetical protein ABSH53_07415 [Holophaga sp.]|jgi:hypothetical protein